MDKFFSLPRYNFNRRMLDNAPDEFGVYALFYGEELVYVGAAQGTSIKACLILHQDGALGECTMKATKYTWEITRHASLRCAEILADAFKRLGHDPICQDKAA